MTKEDCYTSLIDDEDEAIEGYIKAKEAFADDPEACDIFDHIIEEEKEHIREIKQLQARVNTTNKSYSLSDAFEDVIDVEFADQEEHPADFEPIIYQGDYAEGFDSVEDLEKALANETNRTIDEIIEEYNTFIEPSGDDLYKRTHLVNDLYDPFLKANDDEFASYVVASRMFTKPELRIIMDDNCPYMTEEEKLAYINLAK